MATTNGMAVLDRPAVTVSDRPLAMEAKERCAPPSALPPLYAEWMDELLGGPIPRETVATCEDCAMLAPAGAPRRGGHRVFAAETKCCTYVPVLSNFLVGRILQDDDPSLAAGRMTVEARLDARVGVTPLGLARPRVQELLYERGSPQAFGLSRALRCPHYLEEGGGRCGIWRHRNGVCTTWFCKYTRGATSQRFWHALEELLFFVEQELARWCALRLDVDAEVLGRLLPRRSDHGRSAPLDAAAIDGRVDDETYRRLWGRWVGRERAFYREAARLVSGLRWAEALAIGGATVRVHARLTHDAYHMLLTDDIPERLEVGPYQRIGGGRESVQVVGYSWMDPLELPRRLVDVLPYFDGRPTPDALRDIRTETGITVDPGLVRRLVDFGILVPPA